MRWSAVLALAACAPDGDGDGWPATIDCDDADAAVSPGTAETCNGLDDDCDGLVDQGATDATVWYADTDGDRFGAPGTAAISCVAPSGSVADGTDCDDARSAAFPGAPEACDGRDDDCDGVADDGAADAETFFADDDGDGHGDAARPVVACERPLGSAPVDDDCDDHDPTAHPGADEWCDGVDDDCDGTADEAAVDASVWYPDADGDGAGDDLAPVSACTAPAGHVATGGDCADGDPALHPGSAWHADADADGFGSVGIVAIGCEAPAGTLADASDCEDYDPAIHPGADERCNFVDDDCDAVVDGADAIDPTTWYRDGDGDGFGTAAYTVTACQPPTDYVGAVGDCDDQDAAISPAAPEDCGDGLDQDCDGIDDACGGGDPWQTVSTADAVAWTGEPDEGVGYVVAVIGDADGDGYLDAAVGSSERDGYLGGVSVIYGTASPVGGALSAEPAVTADPLENELLGASVAAAGDLDADGFDDFFVGAPYEPDACCLQDGRAYLVYGSATRVAGETAASLGVTYASTAGADARLGTHAAPAGDFDGDGFDDAVLGAADHGGYDGAAYLVFGSASRPVVDVPTSLLRAFVGEPGDRVGADRALSSGDVDGDGVSDLVLGAPGGNRAYLVYGDPTRPGFQVPVASVAAWFGGPWDPAEEIELGAATAVTDLDDDGYGDVVAGGHVVSDTALYAGAAYVWTGSATRFPAGATDISAAALTVSGTSVSELVGISVATGDLDGDGRADLAIGAFGWDEPATDAGLVGVLFGGGSPSGAMLVTDVDVRIEGAFGGDYLAWVSAGDLTGDGYDDLFVGASGAAGNDGAVYLVGGADL